jgi:hypothetical protein
MSVHEISLKINRLPTYALHELIDYVDFLLGKYEKKIPLKPLKFEWEGGLSMLKQGYNGVSLQKKALEWR